MISRTLNDVVAQHSQKTALVYGDLRLSYQQLYAHVQGVCQHLEAKGVKAGACVALILPNCPEFVFSFFAAAQLNAVVLPLNTQLKPQEARFCLEDSHAQVMITTTQYAEQYRHFCHELPWHPTLLVIDEHPPSPCDGPVGDLPQQCDAPLIYQYSSGTTGLPKRVTRTHANLHHEIRNFSQTVDFSSADNFLCVVPLFHAHGLCNAMLASVCHGAKLVILAPQIKDDKVIDVPFFFRSQEVLTLIQQEHITVLPAIPHILEVLSKTSPKVEADVSSLRLCFSAGNFLNQTIIEAFWARFGVPLRQLYGCTEAGSVTINYDPAPLQSAHSVGQPMRNTVVSIVDDTAALVPTGQVGEVVIKSATLTQGYDHQPQLSQEAFRQGQFHTGDLGKLDEAGRLYITGRIKLLIDTGGYKVDPLEIERVLVQHDAVQEAAVVGIPGSEGGERIKAVIVLAEPDTPVDDKVIYAYCRAHLADYKLPKIIEYRHKLPKNALNKVIRTQLL